MLERIRGLPTTRGKCSIMKGTAAPGLIKRLDGKRFGTILEIGTCQAVSAAILSCFADTVVTIDVMARPQELLVIDLADAIDRIIPIVAGTEAAKKRLIAALSFDLAFVDGNHRHPAVRDDFEMVRKCGTVLFHDYPRSGSGQDGARVLLDEIRPKGNIERCPPFAWWRAIG